MTRHKRPPATVRAVGRLIVCSHVECGDPRSGAVVGQVVDVRYAAAAIALHEATHPTPERADPLGGTPSPARGQAMLVSRPDPACAIRSFF
jgi:hypothetical protein